MKETTKKAATATDAKVDTVPRLVRIPLEDDQWLEEKAREKAKERGKATIQDCVREIIRHAREAEAAAA
jgi:hypothetical protein